jgi:hypothetical protein
MTTVSEPLPRRLFPLPERLVASSLNLLCLALLANAVFQPYLGLFHDARLYAFYLESRLEPEQGFDQDLYLLYGSQDRYSLFSFLMLPLVRLIGLDVGMFVVYVLSKALLYWGCQRLIRALTRDDMLTAVIVLFFAVAPVPFGGNEVFHVNESFLTPRLIASGLVLLGLERALAGKILLPAALFLGAMAMHPLMGVGGVLTWVLWWLFGYLKWWQLTGALVLSLAASVGVLAYEPVGTHVFGHMDDAWREINLQICFFIKPTEWTPEDWARMAWDALIVMTGAWTFARQCSRFLWAVLAAGLIGLVWSLVGVETHYLLLIQTSPYRTLWLLEFVAAPVGFMAVAALWKRGTTPARCASLALLLYNTDERDFSLRTALFVLLLAAALGTLIVWHRGLGRKPAHADWVWLCGRNTFLAGIALLVTFAGLVLWVGVQTGGAPLHPASLLRVLGYINARLVCLLVVCQAAGVFGAALGYARRFRIGLAGSAVAYLAVLSYLQASPWYLTRFVPEERHTEFVADYLRERGEGAAPAPCVYWNTDIDRVWFRLRATSYVTIYQMAGCAFNRATAEEGKRRVHLVGRFEADAERRSPKKLPARWLKFYADFRDSPPDAPPPTRADLFRLAQEEQLDYVVLDVSIDDLYSKTDGQVYVYDCHRLRALAAMVPAVEPGTIAGGGR